MGGYELCNLSECERVPYTVGFWIGLCDSLGGKTSGWFFPATLYTRSSRLRSQVWVYY